MGSCPGSLSEYCQRWDSSPILLTKLDGLEVLGGKKGISLLKSGVTHPPTAKVHHLDRALSGLRIEFPGARTIHCWEKAEDFLGVGMGGSQPSYTLGIWGSEEGPGPASPVPPGLRGKASTRPICCTNTLCSSYGLTEHSRQQPLPLGPPAHCTLPH